MFQICCLIVFFYLFSSFLYLPVPPVSSVVLDEKGSTVEGEIGPFNELSTLILTCDVLKGKNIFQYEW